MRSPRGRRLLALLAVATMILAACGSDDDSGSASGGDGQTFKVRVDPKPDEFNASFLHYFPDRVKAHPGDTIEYSADFTGEPHTVSFGSMLKPLLDLAEKYKDTEPPPEAEEEFGKAFSAIPQTFNPENFGKGDPFVQAGWEPCFYATGKPPLDKACDAAHQKRPDELTGKEVLFSSGFMAEGKTFPVKLSDDITPGEYIFTCLFHGPEMTSTIEVVGEDVKVPSPSAAQAAGQKELDEFVAALKPAVDKVRNNTGSEAQAGAEAEGEDGPPGSANVFPTNIQAKVGDTVTWSGIGFHTLTFNSTEDMRPAFVQKDGKGLHLNQKAVKPVNSPDFPPDPEQPPPDDAPEPKLDGGAFNGAGIKHSGINPGDQTFAYSIKFTKAGTYEYLCVVHPDMEGKVTVT
jgi:plastocyanin